MSQTPAFTNKPGPDESAAAVATEERAADLRVRTPGVEPLDRGQTAVQLSVSGDETRVTVELDHDQAEHLVDAIATTD